MSNQLEQALASSLNQLCRSENLRVIIIEYVQDEGNNLTLKLSAINSRGDEGRIQDVTIPKVSSAKQLLNSVSVLTLYANNGVEVTELDLAISSKKTAMDYAEDMFFGQFLSHNHVLIIGENNYEFLKIYPQILNVYKVFEKFAGRRELNPLYDKKMGLVIDRLHTKVNENDTLFEAIVKSAGFKPFDSKLFTSLRWQGLVAVRETRVDNIVGRMYVTPMTCFALVQDKGFVQYIMYYDLAEQSIADAERRVNGLDKRLVPIIYATDLRKSVDSIKVLITQ